MPLCLQSTPQRKKKGRIDHIDSQIAHVIEVKRDELTILFPEQGFLKAFGEVMKP